MAYRGDSNEGGCIALFVAIGVFIAFILNLPSILTWFWKSINGPYGGVWIIVIVFGCIYIKELIKVIRDRFIDSPIVIPSAF